MKNADTPSTLKKNVGKKKNKKRKQNDIHNNAKR